jgi:hypothetical protein
MKFWTWFSNVAAIELKGHSVIKKNKKKLEIITLGKEQGAFAQEKNQEAGIPCNCSLQKCKNTQTISIAGQFTYL